MGKLMEKMGEEALKAGVPLSVQFDLTSRCHERCIYCYLDHDDHGEMSTTGIMDVLRPMAEAGTFFVTFWQTDRSPSKCVRRSKGVPPRSMFLPGARVAV